MTDVFVLLGIVPADVVVVVVVVKLADGSFAAAEGFPVKVVAVDGLLHILDTIPNVEVLKAGFRNMAEDGLGSVVGKSLSSAWIAGDEGDGVELIDGGEVEAFAVGRHGVVPGTKGWTAVEPEAI